MISVKFNYCGHGMTICLCDDCKKKLMEALLPANNSEIPNSSDTISRAKAIDGKICIQRANGVEIYDDYAVPVEYLKQLPPAQPEQSIAEWQKDFREYINMLNIPRDDYKGIMEYINEVPSAQPERTCVNCGRTVNNGGWYADGGTRCPIEEHYALPKDGYCHLWEKRNVTDDDYPERRTDE